ncbi:anti-sigma factor [Rathayibacter sp. YIM 133350]|uniref:anti-sigma factor n=1 Tax=Rathayibacter sp. YIM 133350 TaxID=3131992 RepID=UPI00307F1142
MNGHNSEELRALAAAGALDALTEEERARLDAARATDADLAAEAAAFEVVATQLALSVPSVEPPASMRDALMARIAVTAQADASPAAASAAAQPRNADAAPKSSAAPAAPGGAGPVETAARRRWGTRVGAAVAAVAAAAGLFFAGIAVGGAIGGGNESTVASALTEINAAPDTQHRTQRLDDGRTASVVWSDELERGALLVDELPSLASDQTYEAWVITDAGAQPAGTFESVANGVTVHLISGGMPEGASIGVTVEPSGGSKAPTSDPIIAISTA